MPEGREREMRRRVGGLFDQENGSWTGSSNGRVNDGRVVAGLGVVADPKLKAEFPVAVAQGNLVRAGRVTDAKLEMDATVCRDDDVFRRRYDLSAVQGFDGNRLAGIRGRILDRDIDHLIVP